MKPIDKNLERIELKLDQLISNLEAQNKKAVLFGEWISEKEVKELTGLGRSTLLKLRNDGKITSSTLSGKQTYYRMGDFKLLLNKNEKNR